MEEGKKRNPNPSDRGRTAIFPLKHVNLAVKRLAAEKNTTCEKTADYLLTLALKVIHKEKYLEG